MKAEIDLLVNDHFGDGQTSMVNINGNITDKISISNKELYDWCRALTNDDAVTFIIINPYKDFLFVIEGAEDTCYIHDNNSDSVEKDFLSNIETEISIHNFSHDNDPTKEYDGYATYSKNYIKEYEPDLLDNWIENNG